MNIIYNVSIRAGTISSTFSAHRQMTVDTSGANDTISPFIVNDVRRYGVPNDISPRASSKLHDEKKLSGHGVRPASRSRELPTLRSKFVGCSITLLAPTGTSRARRTKEPYLMDYRIICTIQEPSTTPGHGHIVRVGTGTTARGYNRLWTVAEVYSAMDAGLRFMTYGEQSRKWALVEKFRCCHRDTLRSASDAIADNNLDKLPMCNC